MKKFVLIDANALVHRAFHALPPLNSPKGLPTNAVYGFTTVLLKMLGQLKPDYVAAAFDMAGPTFRHAKYVEYKATRTKAPDELYAQIPLVKRMLNALHIPVLEHKGVEADDIIGTVAERFKARDGLKVVIVTGDLDTLQLVDKDRVVVVTLRKGMSDTVLYDEQSVKDRFGIRPSQVVDYKGLKGDPSDNIPGVPGVGEKTATSLIATFGSIEGIYTALHADTGSKKAGKASSVSAKMKAKLLEHEEKARFSKELATIVRDVPVGLEPEEADWQRNLDVPAVKALCQEFGFYSLVKRIEQALAGAAPQAPQLELDAKPEEPAADVRIAASVDALPEGTQAAVHVQAEDGDTFTVFAAVTEEETWRLDGAGRGDVARVLERYGTVLTHDAKQLLKLSGRTDISTDAWFDTMIAAWLINPELRDYGLDRIAYETLNHYLSEHPAGRPAVILRLAREQRATLEQLKLDRLMYGMEMPLVAVLARMEDRGILVDRALITSLAGEAKKELTSLEKKIHKLAGGEFNIGSPKQLAEVLFERLAIRGKVRRTSTGALSTAAGELEKLADEHPVIALILQWRELSKLVSTYIEPFPLLIREDGRIHTTYNQTGTATGRLSSQDPNLQNIPTRTTLGQRFRGAFTAPEGYRLLSLDYSQIELRIAAHLSADKTMQEVFARGEDIHTRTASEVFRVPADAVTKDMRRQAKVLNFGIIYGMGVMGFARAAGVPRESARRFIDDYFARFPGVADYMNKTKRAAAKEGHVRTLLGRHRPLPDIASTMPQVAAQAERIAINHPVQGTDADIVKQAMLDLEHDLVKSYGDKARMLLQVHDELVLEVHESAVAEVAARAKRIMEKVFPLAVPLVVDAKSGRNWSEMEPV
ncbi:MAG TPA: DNA polymerase I [Candidatus Paceibacterota bacterium]|nr:DNA polymerase I [Candidatus Paceibacterota bacterium]